MLTIVLIIAASLSPLLTFAHLFQLKEWRLDRLREHFHVEGPLRQLFGVARPCLLGFLFSWPLAFLIAVALLNVIQALTRRQPYPVWTKKATILVGTSLLLTTIASYGLFVIGYWVFLVLVPLLQPLFLLASWLLWKPIDSLLKRRILRQAAALRAQFQNLTVIGITGSAGKTTTKELIAHILGPKALATPEHVNSELGVAQWMANVMVRDSPLCHPAVRGPEGLSGPEREVRAGCMVRGSSAPASEHLTMTTCEPRMGDQQPLFHNIPQTLIVEMGAYHEGEIATLCAITQPTMGIITSIGTQHIGLFGSQRAIAETKGELFASLPPSGRAFLPIDTPFAQELRKKCACPVTTVGIDTPADVQATHVEEASDGLRFRISSPPFTIPLHGEHQLPNVLLAVAAAETLGMTLDDIAQRLRTFRPPAHTFALYEENGIHILDDTHNASPESLRAAIAWAAHQPSTPKILLTPGIIEQGSASARTHVQCGRLAKGVFDEAFILNKKLAQYFAEGFGKPVHYRTPKTYNLIPGSLLVCVGRVAARLTHSLSTPSV